MVKKEDKQLKQSFIIFCVGLGLCGCVLILAGVLIEYILAFYHLAVPQNIVWGIKIILIFLGCFHFWLIKYTATKLKDLFQVKK